MVFRILRLTQDDFGESFVIWNYKEASAVMSSFFKMAGVFLVVACYGSLVVFLFSLLMGSVAWSFLSFIFLMTAGAMLYVLREKDSRSWIKWSINLEFEGDSIRLIERIKRKYNLKSRKEAIERAIEMAAEDKKALKMTEEDWERDWKSFIDHPEDDPPKEG